MPVLCAAREASAFACISTELVLAVVCGGSSGAAQQWMGGQADTQADGRANDSLASFADANLERSICEVDRIDAGAVHGTAGRRAGGQEVG